MFGILNSYAFLSEHPVVGLAVFAIVSIGVIVVLSGGKLGDTLGGMFRVFFTFFTTPFVFLRDALTAMRESSENEQDYKQSRVFMMFRFNKLQYLGLLVLCLLILSSGITTSVLTLYPSSEIAQGRALDEQIEGLEAAVATAEQEVRDAGAPGFREQLQASRQQARAAHQQQVQSNVEFYQGTQFSGAAINQLRYADSNYDIDQVRSNIDAYMSGCPRGYNWRGYTPEMCTQYQTFVMEFADRRTRELELAAAATEADRAYRDADNAASSAANNLANAQAQLAATREAREAVSLFNPDMITARLAGAIGGFLMTLLSVIFTVWFGATIISFFSWLILMMRGLEVSQSEKLRTMRPAED